MEGEFKIGPPEDSEMLLELFAFVLDRVRDDKSPFIVKPGTLLQWKENHASVPGIEDFKAGLQCKTNPPVLNGWPLQITEKDTWPKLKGGPFFKAVEACIEAAPVFGIHTGREICRLLAAVAQSRGSADETFKEHNLRVYNERIQGALKKYSQARERQRGVETYQANMQMSPTHHVQQAIPVSQQVQTPRSAQTKPIYSPPPPVPVGPRVERPPYWPAKSEQFTGFLSTERISLWHASHAGPAYAGKSENQDATFACSDGSRVFFALADGVGTSYGSRFSAGAIVRLFCSTLQQDLKSLSAPTPALLKEAATSTHTWLDSVLSYLIANPNAPEWAQVRGASKMGNDAALRCCENTKTPSNRHLGPVMAATLVGGVIQPSADGLRIDGFALRIGDGLIERIENLDVEGGVSSLLSMDSQETKISASISPGPVGHKSLLCTEIIPLSIGVGEVLLMSSDGLTRGHNSSVADKLREVVGASSIGLRPGDESSALALLGKAADYAESAFKANNQLSLFDDNLSLIVLASNQVKVQSEGLG